MIGASTDETYALPCKHKNAVTYYLPRLFDVLPYQGAHQSCAKNEAESLISRHLTSSPDKLGVEDMQRLLAKWLKSHIGQLLPYTKQQVLARRSGRLKRRYEQGFRDAETKGLSGADTKVRAFVKLEKANVDQLTLKPPRMIQHRSTAYCATLAKWLMPVEKLVFSLDSKGAESGVEHRVFAKGMNSWQRAKRIVAMHRWSDTTWLLVDHKRFDSQLTAPVIKMEHYIYCQLLGENPELNWLLSQQINNKGVSMHGVRYAVTGTKMSGEYNTALGDSLVNYSLLRQWTEHLDAEIFVDGDDSVVAISTAALPNLDLQWFEKHGWVTKVDVVSGPPEAVEFCQSRPVEFTTGWRMTRNPIRLLARGVCTVKNYRGTGWYRYIKAGADCEAKCGQGVPVHQEFAKYLSRHTGGYAAKGVDYDEPYWSQFEPTFTGWVEIPERTRASYAEAWGITPTEQRRLERVLSVRDDSAHIARVVAAGPNERHAAIQSLSSWGLAPPC
jgi:hypothetical protein